MSSQKKSPVSHVCFKHPCVCCMVRNGQPNSQDLLRMIRPWEKRRTPEHVRKVVRAILDLLREDVG